MVRHFISHGKRAGGFIPARAQRKKQQKRKNKLISNIIVTYMTDRLCKKCLKRPTENRWARYCPICRDKVNAQARRRWQRKNNNYWKKDHE